MWTKMLDQSGREPFWAWIIHWIACLLGTGLTLLLLAFAVGEGPPPTNAGSAALLIMLVGFLFAWWHGMIGGVISLVGISCFYMWNLAEAGKFPGGLVFPLCFVPGILLVFAWLSLRFGHVPIEEHD
jgi:hypothetical protein